MEIQEELQGNVGRQEQGTSPDIEKMSRMKKAKRKIKKFSELKKKETKTKSKIKTKLGKKGNKMKLYK